MIRFAWHSLLPLLVGSLLLVGCDDDDGGGSAGDTGDVRDTGGDGGADTLIDPVPDQLPDLTVDTADGGEDGDDDPVADADADDDAEDAVSEDVEDAGGDATEDAVTEDVADATGDADAVEDAVADTADATADGDGGAGIGVLIISEVVDGNYTGQGPKWVELTNIGDGPIDLSDYTFGIYSSGGGTTLGGGNADPIGTVTLAATDSYVLYWGPSEHEAGTLFGSAYDVEPDFYAGSFSFNGDDALALFLGTANGDGSDGLLVDVYGEPGTDGTGLPWEYIDTYANREAEVTEPSDVFDIGDWEIGDLDALDGPEAPFETLTSPGEHP